MATSTEQATCTSKRVKCEGFVAIFQALLYSHDKIASHDFGPYLTPETDLYKEEDKGTVKVVQFIKSNEPLVRNSLS